MHSLYIADICVLAIALFGGIGKDEQTVQQSKVLHMVFSAVRAYPDGAGLESTAEGIGCVQTLGHHTSSQAILGVVGALYHLHSRNLSVAISLRNMPVTSCAVLSDCPSMVLAMMGGYTRAADETLSCSGRTDESHLPLLCWTTLGYSGLAQRSRPLRLSCHP